MTPIATWELWAERKQSPRRAVMIAIHMPEPDPKSEHGDFRTLVEMDGITKSRYGHGVNSMQSLVLAMQLLQIHIEHAIREGWQFYFDADDTEPFNLLHSVSLRREANDG